MSNYYIILPDAVDAILVHSLLDHFGWKDGQKLTDVMWEEYIQYRIATVVERIEAKARERYQIKPSNQ